MMEDLGPAILISTWTLTGLSLTFLFLRLICKFKAHRGLWWDDHVLVASWLALLVSNILVALNVSLGSGKHIWVVPPANLTTMGLRGNVVGTLSILAAVWSKTSFAITLLRLMKERHWRAFLWGIIITMNVAMSLNALFLWIRCTPIAKTWDVFLPGTCWRADIYPTYGMFAAGYSAAMDFVLALIPWKIIWGLQMRKKEKLGVAIAMSMGVFAGATSVVKTIEIPTLASGDFTYHSAQLIIWGAAESAVTIIAASIPVLRVLFRDIKHSTRRYYASNSNEQGASRVSKATISRPATAVATTERPRFDIEELKADDTSGSSLHDRAGLEKGHSRDGSEWQEKRDVMDVV